MRYYPLFMDLAGRPCLVVGAGAVAARKARSLLECGARVTVVGLGPTAAFRPLVRRGVVVRDRRFRASDVGRQALIIAATDDRAVNAAVAAAARRKGIPVNAVDDPENCSFIVPAVVTRGDLTVAISTGGRSPAAARLVKELISGILGDEYAALVRLLGAHRGTMKDSVAGQGSRARAWKRMIDAGVLESLRRGDKAGAASTVRRCLADAALTGTAVRRAAAGRRRAVANSALDRRLSAPALEARNSPSGLKQRASSLRERSGAAAPVPERSAMRPPVTTPPSPIPVPERPIKRVRVQGARRADAETYELYVAGRREKGNAADGPFSAAVTVEGWRGGEASVARTAGSTMEVRSDRTPQPARKRSSNGTNSRRESRR